MDETYVKVNGRWVYLYRAIDKFGNTVDFLLRDKRDANAAKAFFKKAIKHNGRPQKGVVDKSGSNKAALDTLNQEPESSDPIAIRQIKYLNHIIEQDHRSIKKIIRPTLSFKNFESAERTIYGIESIRIIYKRQIQDFDKNLSTFQNFMALMAKHA